MAYDGLEFKFSAEQFGTKNAEMDSEHEGECKCRWHDMTCHSMCICNSVQFLTICSVFVGLFTAIDTLEKERTLGAYEALVGLVLKHFEDEEKLGLSEAHLAMHKGLVDIAVAKMGELKAGGAVDDALISLLQNWLKNHIKVTDQQTYGK